jgi:dolichyl-phosphate beta-glucosyltransferase
VTAESIDLSIIIPAYMEAERIVDVLAELAAFLDSRNYGAVEVIVVCADSPDGTANLAASQAHLFKWFRVVRTGPKVGKGRDVRVGIFEARGRYRVFMDADLATPLEHLDEVKAFMDRGGKITIAVRDLFAIHKGIMRKVMSKSANIAAQLLVIPGIKDTQCGFKAFEAEVAEDIFGRMTMLQWSFDMEILAIARLRGHMIEVIQIPDWKDPKSSGAGLVGESMIGVVLSGFLDPFAIRFGIWTGRYKRTSYVHKHLYS